ncbi:S-adenosyl-L-methionine-dependent methyltransferase [Glonium stellatum]|uniref:DNA (cytosine-5-)-methyltransferase n=1 Tax=Glonium stellatum TaxID=574774 RepID=A0A8E2JZJ8_9PEZI|nr:S-adenosyl-L-methionine-dependent methyltransferase [Glonium stellatum]
MPPDDDTISISDDEDAIYISDDEDGFQTQLSLEPLSIHDTIVLSDDEDNELGYRSDVEELTKECYNDRILRAKISGSPPTVTGQRSSAPEHASTGSRIRNLPPWYPFVECSTHELDNDIELRVGETVELKRGVQVPSGEHHSGDFLRIKHIIRNLETDDVTLRGQRFRRTKYLGQIFDWKLNEVVMVLNIDEDDPRPDLVQGMEDVEAREVVRKRDLVITNEEYPRLSFRENPRLKIGRAANPRQHVFNHEKLVCRWVEVSSWRTRAARHTRGQKAYGGVLRRIYCTEADQINKPLNPKLGLSAGSPRSPIDLENQDVQFTSSSPRKRAPRRSPSIELLNQAESPPKRRRAAFGRKNRYLFADGFHGAGGASRGAKMAGLRVVWGFDKESLPCEAYKPNFPRAKSFQVGAADFPPPFLNPQCSCVDIFHLSPPCCFFSPAHTVAGVNDQDNHDALFTVGPLLRKCKPRIAILEQTYGLLEHHRDNFRRLAHDIISAGYNFRYRKVNFAEYGLPQRRKRLIIIAARDGIPLPPFPERTHGYSGTGLKRFTSVYSALEPLRTNPRKWDPYHEPESKKPLNKPPYDARNSLLPGCITGGGGQNFHYSGKRGFTVREYSLLQGFPMFHEFAGNNTAAMLQVGNAFPPVVASKFFEQCAKTLEDFDNGLINAHDGSMVEELPEVRQVTLPRRRSTAEAKREKPNEAPFYRLSPPGRHAALRHAIEPARPRRAARVTDARALRQQQLTRREIIDLTD